MAAGLGFKTFTTGEVLTAADVNGYLMQGILVFASSAARATAITSPQEGQYSYLKDTNALEYYDGAAWVGAPVGDITAVTAGKGLTGGGSSGDVTVSLATTAKGDLVAGSGATTAAVLTVGANNTVLTADSTTATGLKWATPASGSTYVGASVRNSTNQSISNTTETLLTWDTERFDTDNIHSTTTNTGRMTVPTGKAGKWLVSGQISHPNYGSTLGMEIYVYVNGSYFQTGVAQFSDFQNTGGRWVFASMSQIFNLSAGDYLELYGWQNSGGTANINSVYSNFQFTYMGA